jgi:hypothetical protein
MKYTYVFSIACVAQENPKDNTKTQTNKVVEVPSYKVDETKFDFAFEPEKL